MRNVVWRSSTAERGLGDEGVEVAGQTRRPDGSCEGALLATAFDYLISA